MSVLLTSALLWRYVDAACDSWIRPKRRTGPEALLHRFGKSAPRRDDLFALSASTKPIIHQIRENEDAETLNHFVTMIDSAEHAPVPPFIITSLCADFERASASAESKGLVKHTPC